MSEKRTILLVWSWTSSGIGEGGWRVAAGAANEDRVICRDWRVPANDDLTPLRELIHKYAAGPGDLMIFLHRHHGYHQAHVKALMQAWPDASDGRLRVFLFGEGADAIYLANNPRGLLGISGNFSARVDTDGRTVYRTAVADADRRLLKFAHFNHVWEGYLWAARRRVFELQEDLFDALGRELPATTFASGEAYALLNRPEHRLLMLRLLSFAGRIRKGSNLAGEIRTFERNTNRTLTFDDCGVQVATSYGEPAAEQYARLRTYVLRRLLARGEEVSLFELREMFMELLARMPGLTYHS